MAEHVETVIIGAGQAGLSMSYWLNAAGREHVLLERGRVAERWRSERWDSLTVLAPNWMVTLPGHPYAGDDPDGFMGKDEVVSFIEDYAAQFHAPVRTGVAVNSIRQVSGPARFAVECNVGSFEAANIVVATGPFQEPSVPTWSTGLPASVFQVHSSRYRNPAQLPPGAVLVVGSGSSGQQIVEDLLTAERRVYLSVGRHGPTRRRYREHDWTWWMRQSGRFDLVVDAGTPERPAPVLTGVDGGHDLDLRRMAVAGVTLLGHARGGSGTTLRFAADLAESMGVADADMATAIAGFDSYIEREGIAAPPESAVEPLPNPKEMDDPILELDLDAAGAGAIVWATGFHYAFDWVQLPVLDETGRPQHQRGVTACRGMYFLGLRRQYKIKSSFISGAAEDSAYLAAQITGQ